MSQEKFNTLFYTISVIVAVFVFAESTVFKSRAGGELSFAFLILVLCVRHASHKAEIEELKRDIKKHKYALLNQKRLLEIQLERSFNGEEEFRLYLETEIATLRKILSEYEIN